MNVVGSTIAREDDGGIYLHAGPEIGVATTKAFTSQVIALALLTLKLGRLRNMSVVRGREIAQAMLELPAQIQSILDRAHEIEAIAERFTGRHEFPLPRPRLQFPGGTRRARSSSRKSATSTRRAIPPPR